MSTRRFVDKLAVSSEPGLSNAQLMLVNHDLRPGKYFAYTYIRNELHGRNMIAKFSILQSNSNGENGDGGISSLFG